MFSPLEKDFFFLFQEYLEEKKGNHNRQVVVNITDSLNICLKRPFKLEFGKYNLGKIKGLKTPITFITQHKPEADSFVMSLKYRLVFTQEHGDMVIDFAVGVLETPRKRLIKG